MKILFLSTNVDLKTGSGRFASSLILALTHSHNINYSVLVDRGEKKLLPNTYPVLFRHQLLRFLINPLIIAWYSRNVDHVHAFDGWPWTVLAFLSYLITNKPYSCSLYATYAVAPLYKKSEGWLMRATYRHSVLNAPISHITDIKLKTAWPEMKTSIILQGINSSQYLKDNGKRLVQGDYILTVATIKKRKGFHYAFPVFAELKKTLPDLKYAIVARRDDSGYCKKVLEIAEELGISNDLVWFEGLPEEDLVSLYQGAKVFFLPSVSEESREYFEGFGSVYLEAQACGLPVVTSRGGGQEDALIDGQTGYLVKEGDIPAYTACLNKIISDPVHRDQMSKASLLFASSMDWRYTAGKYYDRFQSKI